jgi:transposase InsO family protein
VKVKHKARLLSDNGPCYLSGELAEYLNDNNMTYTRGRPYHPQTQGKIERWHCSMKNQVLLENYYFPNELKTRIGEFVTYYNHERYHESLDNLTPAMFTMVGGKPSSTGASAPNLKPWRCESKTIMIIEQISSIDGRDTLLN